nr:hypothetical protein [Boldiaceae sp.]
MTIAICYLLLLLFFLIIISYSISIELLKIYKEKRLINIFLYKTNHNINHLTAAKLYLSKRIIDSVIYELKFSLKLNIVKEDILIDIYSLLGKSYSIIKSYDKATKYYIKALNIWPKDLQLLDNYINILITQKKIEQATNIYRNFLKDNPNNIAIINKLNDLNKVSINNMFYENE